MPKDDVCKKLKKDKTHYYYPDQHATLNGFSVFMWAYFGQFFIKTKAVFKIENIPQRSDSSMVLDCNSKIQLELLKPSSNSD